MSWLIAETWILLLVAFVLGSGVAWLVHRLVHRLVRNPARGTRS
jgi:predicted PurR-regulated permease PerM